MPAWVKDHEVWEKAKAQVREEYPDLSEDNDRFYALTTAIYKKMGGEIGTAKALLVFGKAHVNGHYRTVDGQEVYVRPHEDSRPAVSNAAISNEEFMDTLRALQAKMKAAPLIQAKLGILEEGIEVFSEMIENAHAHAHGHLSPERIDFYQLKMEELQAKHDELKKQYPTVKPLMSPQRVEAAQSSMMPAATPTREKTKSSKPKEGEQISLFKRIGRGLRLFFKSQTEPRPDLHAVKVKVGGHYRTKPTGETEYVKPHQATRRKRVSEAKLEPSQPVAESGPAWRPAGRPEVIATGQYGGSVYEFSVAPHWPHDNFHVLARVKGWGDWEPAHAGVGQTYDDTVREFVKRNWNKDAVEFHDPVARAHDEHLWADHHRKYQEAEAERQREAEAQARRAQYAQKLRDHLREHVTFKKGRMQLAVEGKGEPVTVEGPALDGLLVHRPMGYDASQKQGPKGWHVSHLASGRRLAHYDNQTDAKISVMRLAPLLDWHQDADAVVAFSKHPDHAAVLDRIKTLIHDPYAEFMTKSLRGGLSRWLQQLLVKAHVKTYTRSDGTVVQEHNDKRQSARPDMPVGKAPRSKRPVLQWNRQGQPKAQSPTAPSTTFDATMPPKPGRIEEWLHRVNHEPDIQQAMREVLEGTPTAHLYKQEGGAYAPERAKLHEAIVSSMLNPRAVAEEGQRPQACILLGAPASGKTTALQPAARELGVEFTVINADDVKEKLPEYTGRNAGLVHTESSDIAEGKLLPRALRANHHLLIDITGGNGKKVEAMVEAFHKAGYDISIMYVNLPIEKTAARAVERFRKSGRFVPPEYIVNTVDGNPEETYNKLKDDPRVSHWRRYSSDVEKDQRAIRQEQGHRSAATTPGRAIAKSVVGGADLAGVQRDGGAAQRHHSQEPGRVHQYAAGAADLLARAQQVREEMLKSLARLDQDLCSPDLDPPMRGTLLAERLKMLEHLEALNAKQAQLLAVVEA